MTPPSTSSASSCGATCTTRASPSTTRPARSSTPASSVARATSSALLAPHHVAAALDYARLRDLRVAVRAGGHSVAGLSLVDDGIVIDVRGFREITVDPERRVVRAGAGLTWSELDAATQAHGLATVGGRVSSTGVAGLALGGGSGWLERKHGLACDNILAVELVTAAATRCARPPTSTPSCSGRCAAAAATSAS